MPRPLRIRNKEADIAAQPPADEVEKPASTEAIDPQSETATIELNGSLEEHETPVQRYAKRFGWKPDWEGPADKRQDAETFLDRAADEDARLKESLRDARDRLRRQSQVAQELADQAAQRAREELAAEIKRASEAGDTARVEQATAQLIRATPDGRVEAWVTRNPWFRTDPKAEMVARAQAEEAKRMGASVEAQLEAAEAEVRKRFPEHFGQDDHRDTNGTGTVRLSDRRAPLVEGGTRAAAPLRSRVKTWNDIPGQDRYQMTTAGKHGPSQLAMFARKLGGEDKAKTAMAQAYWREQGEA